MPRVKGGTVTRARRKKTIKLAKGYFGSKHTLYKVAKQQVMKSGQYAFRWTVVNVNVTSVNYGLHVSTQQLVICNELPRLMNGLKKAGIDSAAKCYQKSQFLTKKHLLN